MFPKEARGAFTFRKWLTKLYSKPDAPDCTMFALFILQPYLMCCVRLDLLEDLNLLQM